MSPDKQRPSLWQSLHIDTRRKILRRAGAFLLFSGLVGSGVGAFLAANFHFIANEMYQDMLDLQEIEGFFQRNINNFMEYRDISLTVAIGGTVSATVGATVLKSSYKQKSAGRFRRFPYR